MWNRLGMRRSQRNGGTRGLLQLQETFTSLVEEEEEEGEVNQAEKEESLYVISHCTFVIFSICFLREEPLVTFCTFMMLFSIELVYYHHHHKNVKRKNYENM